MATNFIWRGSAVQQAIRGHTAKLVEAAAIIVENRAKELITEPYPPASAPGQPPHRRTGRLRASISHSAVDQSTLTVRVGTNVKYGMYLELGTRKMAARPWLRPALAQSKAKIAALFARGGA